MKKQRGIVPFALVLLMSVVFVSGTALGESIEIPVSGDMISSVIDPGHQWIDDEGITHIRGWIQDEEGTGQDDYGIPLWFAGIWEGNFNFDETYTGDLAGFGTYEMTYGELSGTIEGRVTMTMTYGLISGEFNLGHGGGDFEGWHFRGTFTSIFGSGVLEWEGVLHNPHGE
jgi:hypothetical protein